MHCFDFVGKYKKFEPGLINIYDIDQQLFITPATLNVTTLNFQIVCNVDAKSSGYLFHSPIKAFKNFSSSLYSNTYKLNMIT